MKGIEKKEEKIRKKLEGAACRQAIMIAFQNMNPYTTTVCLIICFI